MACGSELVGSVPPAVTGATLAAIGVADVLLVARLTIAGLFEGAATGVAQARMLARCAPAVDGRDTRSARRHAGLSVVVWPGGDSGAVVERLVADVGLWPVRVGASTRSRWLDMVVALWPALALGRGRGRRVAFKALIRWSPWRHGSNLPAKCSSASGRVSS